MSNNTEEIDIKDLGTAGAPKWLVEVQEAQADSMCKEINDIYAQAIAKLNADKG